MKRTSRWWSHGSFHVVSIGIGVTSEFGVEETSTLSNTFSPLGMKKRNSGTLRLSRLVPTPLIGKDLLFMVLQHLYLIHLGEL